MFRSRVSASLASSAPLRSGMVVTVLSHATPFIAGAAAVRSRVTQTAGRARLPRKIPGLPLDGETLVRSDGELHEHTPLLPTWERHPRRGDPAGQLQDRRLSAASRL